MAVVRNITPDELSVLGQTVPAGETGEFSDEDFADRAWPHSTWELVTKPAKAYTDASPDDAYVFSGSPNDSRTVAELRALAGEKGVDLSGLTKKDDIIAAIESHDASEETP